jgi:hypothetical protein
LLHSLGINKTYQINALIKELLKLKGKDGMIEYTQKITVLVFYCKYLPFIAPVDTSWSFQGKAVSLMQQ